MIIKVPENKFAATDFNQSTASTYVDIPEIHCVVCEDIAIYLMLINQTQPQ
jgi:hypothetical protein